MSPFRNILKLESGNIVFNRGLDMFNENLCKYDTVPIGNIKFLNSQIKDYDVEIEVNKDKLELKKFRCTCPYFQQKNTMCKHIVALCLSYEHEVSGGLEQEEVQSVSQLNNYIKTLLEEDKQLKKIEVKGEISTFSPNRSGHVYFSIKDNNSILNCVMFKSKVENITFNPKTGDSVILKGSISLYEPRGSYQLIVNSMKKEGEGDLFAKFLELKNKLDQEGLFDPNKKKQIPKFPKKIGVITSQTGAVIQDIINTVTRRFPKLELQLYPAKVQGDDSLNSLIEALDFFNKSDVDTVIIARGGGSIEDLWIFNNEILARKISNLNKPIISAIGHETDFTICDFVADLRAPTPTAAAEIATPKLEDLNENIKNYKVKTHNILKRIFEYKQMNFLFVDEKLSKISKQLFKQEKEKLNHYSHKIELLSHKRILNRGFSITQTITGNIITNQNQINSGEEYITHLKIGKITGIKK